MKGSFKDGWMEIVDYDVDYVRLRMKGLCKSMDHRKVMGKICRIMDEGWGDGGM